MKGPLTHDGVSFFSVEVLFSPALDVSEDDIRFDFTPSGKLAMGYVSRGEGILIPTIKFQTPPVHQDVTLTLKAGAGPYGIPYTRSNTLKIKYMAPNTTGTDGVSHTQPFLFVTLCSLTSCRYFVYTHWPSNPRWRFSI